ncbi:hypothetical protein HNQ93_000435 [Hymenobacter luteus]|uniref:DUF3089 domain-containing protein n=2 Tax=Hymenobacter TaxID=89966 RepID=A0A7W9WAR6_9BACT|nr:MULTISPECIES: DUF3089 domain-containing protein [Hymenobacter]MBB4600085.1 hypothetical protein [Hymenobacter latericoloratus]MBB6057605.1 hypothetical protein [Hymenobacter luteus]
MHTPLFRLPLLGALLALGSCLTVIKPGKDFARVATPEAPDYRMEDNWAALPDRRDSADAVPRHTRLRNQQRDAPVDVFFVHPTTYYGRTQWNASLTDARVNHLTDASTIRKQASAFNSTGRIYAPRYRQATLFSFFDEHSTNGQEALAVAYSDVKTAFQYYLDHYNQGRPIVIASHSQGTHHATRLLREFFDQDPKLRRQLVAAYLIGFKVQPEQFQVLRPCDDSTQTGCYVGWNTVEWGQEYPPFQGGVAVNPLTWTRDTATAPARLNLGGVPYSFDGVDKRVVDAKVHNGLVWIHPTTRPGYPRFLLPGRPELRHSFHIADYSLFYYNIRQNAEARVRSYRMLMHGG